MDILQSVMDSSSHAMFTIDREGIVTHINQQAKERFGLYNHSGHTHAAGRLNRGDLVLLASTAIGADDGNLRPEDLRCIGINDYKLRMSDRIVAIGVYNEPAIKPLYKAVRSINADTLHLETEFQGVPVRVAIESDRIAITVWETEYSINYFRSICQMVVVDRAAHRVKFWEENGYSARKEGVGNLLRGASFVAKGPEMGIDVVGYYFKEFFEGELFEQHLHQVMSGQTGKYEDQEYEINGFSLLATILPIKNGEKIDGAIVRFRNIQDIKAAIMERNAAIRSAERAYREAERSSLGGSDFGALGSSSTMAAVRRYAYKLSQMDCPILITGERGTGKSAMAAEICRTQPRKGPVLTADCTAILPERMEGELFGYGAGAPGIFEKADGGTVFLEGIDALSTGIQAKLLNVVQSKTIVPVGSTHAVSVDVRLLASGDSKLRDRVADGSFRDDLYYRLSAFSLELPPLRSCREDIPILIESLMDKIRQKYGMPEKYLSGEAFHTMLTYDWPGNISELENVLERAMTLAESDIIYLEHIRLEGMPAQRTLRQQLKETEARIIRQTLAQCGGDRQRAMQQLGISRSVFYDKLKEHGIK